MKSKLHIIVEAGITWLVEALLILWLWNALMPDIFGLPEVTYLQSLGLYWLSEIFFKPPSRDLERRKRDERSPYRIFG